MARLACTDRYELVCRDEFARVNAKLDGIDAALRGDGEKPGVIGRLDRLERSEKARVTIRRVQIACLGSLVTGAVIAIVRLLWYATTGG